MEWGAPPQPKSHIKNEMKKKFENIIIKLINVKLDIIFHILCVIWVAEGTPHSILLILCEKSKESYDIKS